MSEADDIAAITPPPELRRLWAQQAQRMDPHDPVAWQQHVATKAARWGADQELEACCQAIAEQVITIDNIGLSGPAGVLHSEGYSSWPAFAQMVSRQLRAARRPKPPSLKEQALAQTDAILNDPSRVLLTEVRETLELNRRALEALND